MSIESRVSPYDYTFDSAGDGTAARICRLVGDNRRVLELGCGYGIISRQLSRSQQCRVTGVEIDAASAEHARPYLEHLYVGNLEGEAWREQVGGGHDVIVCADVIEHLRDPEATLRQLVPLLAPGGRFVVSIPNAGHAGILAALFAGRFDYTPTGLLDETHLRFFTWNSVEKLFNRIGLQMTHRESVQAGGSHEQFLEYWRALPASLRAALDSHPTANVFQYVFTAMPSPAPQPLAVPDEAALDAWRSTMGGA